MATVLTPAEIKQKITDWITTNGNHEITGAHLNTILAAIMDYVGVGYAFMGEAPASAPSPDVPSAYLAAPGTYTNYESGDTVIPEGSIAVLKYDGSAWSKSVIKVCDPVSVSQNTSTGHTDISVGGTTTPVGSMTDIAQLIRLKKANVKLSSPTNITNETIGGYYNPSGAFVSNPNLAYQKVTIDHTKAYQIRVSISGTSLGISTLVFFDANDNVMYANGQYVAVDEVLMFPDSVVSFGVSARPSAINIQSGTLDNVEHLTFSNNKIYNDGAPTDIQTIGITHSNDSNVHTVLNIGGTNNNIVGVNEIRKWSLLSPNSVGQVPDTPKLKWVSTPAGNLKLYKSSVKITNAYCYIFCDTLAMSVLVYSASGNNLTLKKEVITPKSGLYALGVDVDAGDYVGVYTYKQSNGIALGANASNQIVQGGETWYNYGVQGGEYSSITIDASTSYTTILGFFVGNGRSLLEMIEADDRNINSFIKNTIGAPDMTPEARFATIQNQTIVRLVEQDMPNPYLYLHLGGTLPSSKFCVYRLSMGHTLERVYSKELPSGVYNGLKIDFPLLKGDIVGVYGGTSPYNGGVGFYTKSATTLFVAGTDLSSFTLEDVVSQNVIVEYKFGVVNKSVYEALDSIKDDTESIKAQLRNLYPFSYQRMGVLKTTNFNSTTLPTGWSNSGFTLSSDGATPTSEGDLLQVVQRSDLNASCLTVLINATTAFSTYLVRYKDQYPTAGGWIVEFDFINKKVNLYSGVPQGETPTTIIKSFDIPFDFVAGSYVLSIANFAEIQRFSIFGAGTSVDFYVDGKTITSGYVRPHDDYGVKHKSGTYVVKQVTFSCPMAESPDVLVVGDSIAEADTIRLEQNGGFENSWVGLLSKKTLLSLWAEGGNTSQNINQDQSTLVALFRPKKVIYAIGTNDSDYNLWLTNVTSFTSAFEALGAEVIYTTSVLRPYIETSLSQQRAWIKASGHRYIDFLAATTVDGAGVTRKDGYFLADELHPTPLGHKAMYEAVLNTLPDLLTY